MKLHHYTTPGKLDSIIRDGLKPRSDLPGTNQNVTFAFLREAQHAWPTDDHGIPRGINVLDAIERKERNGLIHLTFEAPNDTYVYDRDLLEPDDASRYLWRCTNIAESHNAKLPEAVTSMIIKPYDLRIEETLDHEAARALIHDFSNL